VPIDPQLANEWRAAMRAEALPNYRTMRMHLAAAVKACGYDEALTIHCLRHTTATRLGLNKENPKLIMDFLGHKSLATTMKYTHIDKAALLGASKNLSPHAGKVDENDTRGEIVEFKKAL